MALETRGGERTIKEVGVRIKESQNICEVRGERRTLRLAEKGMSKDEDISHTLYVKML